MNTGKLRLFSLFLFMIVALLLRWVPHPANFSAVGALALFSGALWGRRLWAPLIPLVVLFLSDLVLGFHTTMVWVYAGFVLVALIGMILQPQKPSQKFWLKNILAASLTSLVFFIVSNFGVWMVDGLYPMTAQGLVQCFAMALPFLDNQWVGDLIFVTAFAGAYRLLAARFADHQTHASVLSGR